MKYLTPEAAARIRALKARPSPFRTGGTLEGRHASAFKKGSSQEFSQYRQYTAGSDTRFLDWKVYARRDRLFIKEFSLQSAVSFHLLLDSSASMGFRGPAAAVSKWEYSARLALYLACFLIARGDYAGLTVFSGGVTRSVRPSGDPRVLTEMDALLESLEPSGDSLPPGALKSVASELGRNSAAVVFSDFMAPSERMAAFVRLLSSFRGKAWAFQALDRAELDLPWIGRAAFKDMETGDEVQLAPDAVRTAHAKEFGLWVRRTEKLFSVSGIRAFTAFTDVQPFMALEKLIRIF
jgi:uncharacterized protein (DUF58 family)